MTFSTAKCVMSQHKSTHTQAVHTSNTTAARESSLTVWVVVRNAVGSVARRCRYLPWRTQLYSLLCYAYSDVRSFDQAKKVVQDGLARIDALIKLQKLDPVPAPPEIQVRGLRHTHTRTP